ncbi:MAG: helix-turn-helix domain-containing protein [Propionibacteriaceae bacterium]|jgi:hypothetical protein|nr:helix-turn-helix domain-containing protein [Propionibacteriaceae bacterium]
MPLGLEPLLTVVELAEYLGIPVSTLCSSLRSSTASLASGERTSSFSSRPASLHDWRLRGEGPVAHRFGKHLKFAASDVKAWMASRREGAGHEQG